VCSGAWLFFEKFLCPGTWLFLNFCFFSLRETARQIRRKEETKKRTTNHHRTKRISISTHKTQQQRDKSAFEEGRTEKSRREARCSTNAARYLFIYTRDTSREEETCSRTREQQRHRRGRSLLCRHRTYERAKEGEAIDEHAQRRRRLSLRFRGVFLNELSSLRF